MQLIYVSLHPLHVYFSTCIWLVWVSFILWQLMRSVYSWTFKHQCPPYPHTDQLSELTFLNCMSVADSCVMNASVNALSWIINLMATQMTIKIKKGKSWLEHSLFTSCNSRHSDVDFLRILSLFSLCNYASSYTSSLDHCLFIHIINLSLV